MQRPATARSDTFSGRVSTHLISVDSRNRDRALWPSPARFQVVMGAVPGFTGASTTHGFRRVVSIELADAVYPNRNDVLTEMYMFLAIPELDGGVGTVESTNKGRAYFAKLLPDRLLGNHVRTYIDPAERPTTSFPATTRLDRLTVELRTADGELFDLGVADGGAQPDPALQVSYTFRITVDEPH